MNSPVSKFSLLISVLLVACNMVGTGQERMEEFNGPFASWANVMTRFGAKGDGKHDDTKAIQQALDSLSNKLTNFNQGQSAYSVVYLPAGVYKITSTLILKAKMGVRIVGQDPLTTKLSWQGKDNDTAFWANGSAYFSLSRITWDANGRKGMEAIGLHWKLQNEGFAPEQIEFADHVFNGFAKGISGGTLGGNDGSGSNESEITIRRCTFNDCSVSGILIRGYNALDYWVWHCRFIRCKVGVTSNSGNYHVYQSYFNRSSTSDVYNNNSYYTSVRFCFSENSSAFSLEEGSSSNPFKRIFEGNIVTGITNIGISYTHAGKITMINNVFIAGAGVASKRFLEYGSWAPSHFDLLDINNTIEGFPSRYNIAQPSHIFSGSPTPLEKSVPPVVTSSVFVSKLPPAPPYRKREVFEVPPNPGAEAIQAILNRAAALKRRAVVHFAYGIYNIDKPLAIPVNADLQLSGDGYLYCSTIFKPAANDFVNGAALKIMCPTTVSIRDLEFDLSGGTRDNGRAIVLVGGDQPGAVALLDQLYADNDTSLLVKGYDYTIFQKTNSFFTTGNHVEGGKLIEKGAGTSRVQCFGAQFANCSLSRNGLFTARDCWWEGNTAIPLNLTGNGRFILDGAMIAPRKLDSSSAISIHDYTGRIVLMDMYVIGSLSVTKANPNLELLVWNVNFYHKKRPLAFVTGTESYKAFLGGISTQCFNSKDPECANTIITPDRAINVSSPGDFMEQMIRNLSLTLPMEYTSRPAGVSNFYLTRVAISAKYKTGIAFVK